MLRLVFLALSLFAVAHAQWTPSKAQAVGIFFDNLLACFETMEESEAGAQTPFLCLDKFSTPTSTFELPTFDIKLESAGDGTGVGAAIAAALPPMGSPRIRIHPLGDAPYWGRDNTVAVNNVVHYHYSTGATVSNRRVLRFQFDEDKLNSGTAYLQSLRETNDLFLNQVAAESQFKYEDPPEEGMRIRAANEAVVRAMLRRVKSLPGVKGYLAATDEFFTEDAVISLPSLPDLVNPAGYKEFIRLFDGLTNSMSPHVGEFYHFSEDQVCFTMRNEWEFTCDKGHFVQVNEIMCVTINEDGKFTRMDVFMKELFQIPELMACVFEATTRGKDEL